MNINECEWCGTRYPDFDETEIYFGVNVFGRYHKICGSCMNHITRIEKDSISTKKGCGRVTDETHGINCGILEDSEGNLILCKKCQKSTESVKELDRKAGQSHNENQKIADQIASELLKDYAIDKLNETRDKDVR